MFAVLIFEIIRLFRVIRAGLHPRPLTLPAQTPWFWFRKLGVPLLIGSAVGVWMFIAMPRMFQVPFSVMLLSQPDLTWVIAIAGGLAVLNGMLSCGLNGLRIWQAGKSRRTGREFELVQR